MNIVAICSTLSDFEISCYNTIQKFRNSDNSINLIILKDKKSNVKRFSKTDEFYNKLGISNIYAVENFNYSKVTQENVNLINLIIEKIKPSLVIIPFISTSDKIKKVLAKSSLLACRKVSSILMYETTKNKKFVPNVFCAIDKKLKRKNNSLSSIYAKKMGIYLPSEAFESHRMVLLQNDLF